MLIMPQKDLTHINKHMSTAVLKVCGFLVGFRDSRPARSCSKKSSP